MGLNVFGIKARIESLRPDATRIFHSTVWRISPKPLTLNPEPLNPIVSIRVPRWLD